MLPHALPTSGGRQGTAPPQVVWGKKNFRMLSQRAGVARELLPPQAARPQRRIFRRWLTEGGRGFYNGGNKGEQKGEWSHEAGTDRTRTLRLQQ